jgi:hypothetical protein
MSDAYEFLGLPQSQWQFINTFADWVSAVGTVAAVWVSLWLARGATRPKGRVSANVMLLAGDGELSPHFLEISVGNVGDRPFTVTGVGWRVGLPFARRYAYQKTDGAPDYAPSDSLPLELQIGRRASWRIDLERVYKRDNTIWAQSFASMFLSKWPAVGLWTLRVQAFTSTGHVFTSKPSSDVIKKLREAHNGGSTAGKRVSSATPAAE